MRESSGALAIRDDQTAWLDFQRAAFGQIGIADAPEGDQAVFLHVAQRTGLDPFSQQIYMIPRKEKKSERQPNGSWVDTYVTKWGIQTGIQGWRVIRGRAEKREGVRGILSRPLWTAPDGTEHKTWIGTDAPAACEITYTVVEHGGREVPYTAALNFWEYAQRGQNGALIAQWAVKKAHMIAKCCEAEAYRMAFPQDYSGIDLADAMPPPGDWDAMSDEELTTRAEAVGYRPRATAASVREHAAQRQQAQAAANEPVDAEIVDDPAEQPGPTTSGASSSADAPASESPTPTEQQSPSTPSGSASTGDPHNTVIAELARLHVTTHQGRASYLTRLRPDGQPIASVEALTRKQAGWFIWKLGTITTPDELEAAAVAADTAREASDGQ